MPYNPLSEEDKADLAKRFKHYSPKLDQSDRYAELLIDARQLAAQIIRCSPPSRERSLALTNLEQAVMWAYSAIERNE